MNMMTSSNGHIFRVTGHLCGEFTGPRALMFSLICVWINSSVNNRKAGDLRRHRAHYDVIVMNCSQVNAIWPLWWSLVQVMAWCRQATSQYLNQCLRISLSPYGVTMPQWVTPANTHTNKPKLCASPVCCTKRHSFSIHTDMQHIARTVWNTEVRRQGVTLKVRLHWSASASFTASASFMKKRMETDVV